MMRSRRYLVACAFFLAARTAVGTPLQTGSPASAWTVSAVVITTEGKSSNHSKRVLRLGVKNASGTARLLCAGGWTFSIEHPRHSATRGEGGAHSCRTAESFAVVLAGETLFMLIPTERVDLEVETADLTVDLLMFESPINSTATPRQLTLTWRGKVDDAIGAGQRLVK